MITGKVKWHGLIMQVRAVRLTSHTELAKFSTNKTWGLSPAREELGFVGIHLSVIGHLNKTQKNEKIGSLNLRSLRKNQIVKWVDICISLFSIFSLQEEAHGDSVHGTVD